MIFPTRKLFSRRETALPVGKGWFPVGKAPAFLEERGSAGKSLERQESVLYRQCMKLVSGESFYRQESVFTGGLERDLVHGP